MEYFHERHVEHYSCRQGQSGREVLCVRDLDARDERDESANGRRDPCPDAQAERRPNSLGRVGLTRVVSSAACTGDGAARRPALVVERRRGISDGRRAAVIPARPHRESRESRAKEDQLEAPVMHWLHDHAPKEVFILGTFAASIDSTFLHMHVERVAIWYGYYFSRETSIEMMFELLQYFWLAL